MLPRAQIQCAPLIQAALPLRGRRVVHAASLSFFGNITF